MTDEAREINPLVMDWSPRNGIVKDFAPHPLPADAPVEEPPVVVVIEEVETEGEEDPKEVVSSVQVSVESPEPPTPKDEF